MLHAISMHALISVACALFIAFICVAQHCLTNRRRRRRIPFICQDTEENKKNPGRLSAAAARAARTGDARQIGEWIELVGRGGLDAKGNLGRTAMHFAADMGQGAVIKVLLDAGADVHTLDNAGQTALHIVSINGHGTCVKMLLDAGADPTLTDIKGDSALALAERGGRVGSVRLMRLHISQSRALYGSSPNAAGESTPRHR
jgi:ankyrin repeat protein